MEPCQVILLMLIRHKLWCSTLLHHHISKNKYKFNWDSASIKYLGVILTRDISQLYSENYTHINTHIKEDLDRLLDLANRIIVIKTNILPRLLYLFQSLPIHIPEYQFREWDKVISRFIWNGKAQRVRYKTLQL